ncbi:hypothetical protein CPLU01_09216 [Colletotrichum plurivorum]|uniref:Uncharacterized protein n=1 Tax=Colletotrichum plurivorum TaxID=2175906 RepID=A0A8H6NBZ4_9PEZI|nr:hypothetical protein CPLU01_09216 [Colletotrichum plurivorum]
MPVEASLAVRRPSVVDDEIQIAIKSFLDRCGLVLPTNNKHAKFTAHCISEAVSRGYITTQDNVFRHFIPAAFLVYLDDMFGNDIDAVQQFNHRFITRQPQANDLLDHFADLLLEMPAIFGTIVANMMTTSTLNLVTALSIENEFEAVKLEKLAYRFPTFSRVMSGASETYALFMFPPGQPLPHYLQALPDLMIFINNGK